MALKVNEEEEFNKISFNKLVEFMVWSRICSSCNK